MVELALQFAVPIIIMIWAAVFDEHPEGHILLVCHLGVMRVATARALEMPLQALYRMQASYAGHIRLRRTARGIEIWFGH